MAALHILAADWVKLLLIPTVTVVVVVYVTQDRLAATNARLDKLESNVEINTRIILTDQALTERWGKRLDQIESRHDQIMQFMLSGSKYGSGYTYLPGEVHKK